VFALTLTIETGEQLRQGLAFSAHQHGQRAIPIVGRSNASDWIQHADSDFAVFN
jgi:hypothetical protein